MDAYEIQKQAEEKIKERHPKPKDPTQMGINGLAITAVIVIVFTAMTGGDIEKHMSQFLIVCFLGFIVPFWYQKNEEKKFYKRLYEEEQRIRRRLKLEE